MNILQKKIQTANDAGRMAVIPFITAGFPQKEIFWELLDKIDNAGTDIIEIGVPFSDPVADGPVVEEASRRSLETGVSLEWILKGLQQRKGKYKSAIVLMGYINPFLQYGVEKLAKEAKNAEVAGFIIPDLPYEEYGVIKCDLKNNGLALIPLVGPNTSEQRMKLYASDAEGYVYVVSVMGITGERKNLAPVVAATLKRARKAFNLPLALGFGLAHPDQLSDLPEDSRPDAAVMGSALLKHVDKGKNPEEFLAPWLVKV